MLTRRQFLGSAATAGLAAPPAAQIAITIDLEMARNYPTWDQTHWDYEKGNLDDAAKGYAVEAARRVKALGGVIHFFVVGRVFEQEKVDWLEEIAALGHPVGNHTYDHVNLKATQPVELQPRFRRAPWLIAGKTALQVIDENIRMTSEAMRVRLGRGPAGFRAPGGYPNGIADRAEVQKILLDQGFRWASTKYVQHPTGVPGYDPHCRGGRREPSRQVLDAILAAQDQSQPFTYPSGLLEIPMCPISDLIAFRTAHWTLESFVKALGEIVTRAIDRRMTFVFLGHPSCLVVEDPEFRAIERMAHLARTVDLDTIARNAGRS